MTAPALTAVLAQTPDPPQDLAPAPASPRIARLLTVLQALIVFGKELAATLQASASAQAPFDIAVRFGTHSVAVILARIARGLQLAAALENKVALRAHRRDPVRAASARPPSSPRKPRSPRPKSPQQNEALDAVPTLPTVEEIAEKLRLRPIHAVLAEICSDLGILPSDPLYHHIECAIMENHGSAFVLWKDTRKRAAVTNFIPPNVRFVWPKLPRLSELPLPRTAAGGTGPPSCQPI